MNSATPLTKWQRFRNSSFRFSRLCRILFSRCIDQTGCLFRERRNKPNHPSAAGRPETKPGFTRRLQFLWLTSKLWFLRFCRSFVNYPGWTIATLTGAIGIILLVIVQIVAFLPKSASEAEPLMEPFIEITDVDAGNNKHHSAEVEVLQNDSANGHPPQIETNAQPVFDIDVVLFRIRGVPEDPQQFLVTSVREQHALNYLPIRTGTSHWQPFSLNHSRTAIQPMEYQSPGFRNEPPSAESFVEPFLTKPVHNGIPYFAADILSSAFSTRVTLAGTTIAETKTAETMTEQAMTEQTTIAETPKLNLVVTISDRTQLGQPERIQFRVINSGQVTATNVILSIEIPEEFTYQKGQSLEYKVGTIPPGETRLARLTPKAVTTGVAVFEIEVTADEGFSHILKPQVEIVAGE